MRGILNDEIISIATPFFNSDFTTKHLRLLPYIDYCLKNGGKINLASINKEEYFIIDEWEDKKFITLNKNNCNIIITCSKEFYDIMQQIMWISYVEK